MRIRVQALVPDGNLAFIGDMGRDSSDELQIVHRFQLGALLAVAIPDLALGFQKSQPLQGQERPRGSEAQIVPRNRQQPGDILDAAPDIEARGALDRADPAPGARIR